MIGRVGRAEALSAVALAVGTRQEPVAMLRRLAAADPGLRILLRLAARLEAGEALAAALRSCRLVSRADAARLGALAPEALAAELGRLAQRCATPVAGEILARWFPVWLVLAVVVPSLVIGGIVVLGGGALYGGIWDTLGIGPHHGGPAWFWLLQLAGSAIAVAGTALAWWLLRITPWLRGLTMLSRSLSRAVATADLLAAVQAGMPAQRLLRRWAFLSGDPREAKRAIGVLGGDALAVLNAHGMVPCGADGRVDWELAHAEVAQARAAAAAELAPVLTALVAIAVFAGFISWGAEPFTYLLTLQISIDGSMSGRLPGLILQPMGIAGQVLVAGWVVLLGRWLVGWCAGPSRDWGLVAERLARALDRREDPDLVLRGLRLSVRLPMRRRLAAALAIRDEPHPGRLLARSGVAPLAQRAVLSDCAPGDVAGILRTVADRPDPNRAAMLGQALGVAVVILMLMFSQGMWSERMLRMIDWFQREIPDPGFALAARLLHAGWWASVMVVAGIAVAGVVVALGSWLGWWSALGGWRCLARGQLLSRRLAAGARESELAADLGGLPPARAARAVDAGARGDLPGVLAAAGWRVADGAALDRALAVALAARERRRAVLAIAARLLLPCLLALPIALTASGLMLVFARMDARMSDIARSSGGFTGGLPAWRLVDILMQQAKTSGDAAIDAARAARGRR